MKKHLAIVCGVFYPNPSPTGLCAKRFVQLLRDVYDIDIICLSANEKNEDVVTDDGMHVHTLQGNRMALEFRMNGLVKKLLHLAGAAQLKLSLLGNLTWFRQAAKRKLEEIHCERRLDAVFTICSPFAAHCAGLDFQKEHPEVRWCGYTVDPFATRTRIRPFGRSFEKLIQLEREVLMAMDSVLLSEEVYQNRSELHDGCGHCFPLPYMLPSFPGQIDDQQCFDKGYINCVYAGSFYKEIRNPEGMLQCFAALFPTNIRLHLYSRGCEGVVARYAADNKHIIVHDRVSFNEIARIYRDADVLINIGNSTPEFMPSKVFEYIVSGKPIVNFYSLGYSEAILEKYPICLQIPNKYSATNASQLSEFLHKEGHNSLSKEEISGIYHEHLPLQVCNILTRALDENQDLERI